MRRMILIASLLILAALPASAQRLKLDFPGLAERAEEVVDITLDADMLKLAAKFFSDKDDQDLRDTVRGLQGIYVRSYEFAREGEYDHRLIDQVRSQLGSTWKALVTVRSKSKENVNIYADMRGENIVGLVVIASEPKEFTVVNIVGPIDMDKLSRLQGQFGIPDVSDKKERSRE
jgi:hypothetical protein